MERHYEISYGPDITIPVDLTLLFVHKVYQVGKYDVYVRPHRDGWEIKAYRGNVLFNTQHIIHRNYLERQHFMVGKGTLPIGESLIRTYRDLRHAVDRYRDL